MACVIIAYTVMASNVTRIDIPISMHIDIRALLTVRAVAFFFNLGERIGRRRRPRLQRGAHGPAGATLGFFFGTNCWVIPRPNRHGCAHARTVWSHALYSYGPLRLWPRALRSSQAVTGPLEHSPHICHDDLFSGSYRRGR